MRSLGTRRAGLVAGAATVAVIALAGCSAGQVAETAILQTPIAGVDAAASDGSVLVRNLQVTYNGVKGYEAGEDAPIEVNLYNQTAQELTVAVGSQPLERGQVVSAAQIGLVGTASATPSPGSSSASPSTSPSAGPSGTPAASPSGEPSGPAARPALIKIAPHGWVSFRPGDKESLTALGLREELRPGTALNLVFQFSSGAAPLEVQAPVAIPLSPASRAPSEVEGEGGEH